MVWKIRLVEMSVHIKYFDKAKEISAWSTYNKFRIGCVAVYQNRIIGIGYNCNKTHPIQKEFNRYRKIRYNNAITPTIHAEMMCLLSIKNMDLKWNKVSLYVFRSCAKGYGMARPCAACMEAIKEFGIKNIYYTTDDGFASEKLLPERRWSCA